MSRVTELAELEAQRAEAEEPEEPAAEPPELEPEPPEEPPEEPGEQSAEATAAELEKVIGRHTKAVSKALGIPTGELNVCATCDGLGFTPEPAEPEPELRRDPATEPCAVCGGWGQVLTGALTVASAQPLRPCTHCNGGGYVTKTEQPDAVPTFNWEPARVAAPVAPPPAVNPEALAALRAAGYTVIEPYTAPPAVAT